MRPTTLIVLALAFLAAVTQPPPTAAVEPTRCAGDGVPCFHPTRVWPTATVRRPTPPPGTPVPTKERKSHVYLPIVVTP
jgi:hypothetical protein